MPTIETIVKKRQPRVYEQLMAMYPVPVTSKHKTKHPKKPPPMSTWDIEQAMRHSSYRRTRSGMRQVRQGS